MLFWLTLMLVGQAADAEAARECEFGRDALENEPCPASNPGSWIQNSDYPPAAIRNDEEGIIHFTLEVDENGIVTGCSLEEPSLYPILNDTTCRLLSERAQFIPPQNEAGENVPSRFSSSIRWEIPTGDADMAWIVPHEIDLSITVNSAGDVTDCEVHRLETLAVGETLSNLDASEEFCENMMRNGRVFLSPDEESSFPQRFRYRSSVVPENQP
ncbi:MAG: TonB family protein [Parasphingopyxis sp.]|uniref:TonB family protein n=1 Tax=Parasphingopyxis sp. TaxID=1920299 RepID=UPI003FA0F411